MSRIENDAIKTATALIKDEPLSLTENAQRELAAFLCLISMRLEFLRALASHTGDGSHLPERP